MKLDLTSLEKALKSYENALGFAKERLNNPVSSVESNVVKAGVIQNFEFTYELCWKFMKRWLEFNLMPGLLDGVSRKELFRHALEHKLILDFNTWVKYHELRNTTSHTYNYEIAEEIYEMADEFFLDAKHLYQMIEAKNE
ncbi:nucleotidyltransferase substrate binding protein [Fusibacter sp. 3D3]|uniref:nucleotidyltransferase substrate binding protein n=1 Tax=Fusibacter sp. 3D3 TaxID=1048380 RepID=UPI000853004D|nr:nucleotidyltransferase substrate binding protein [Fusibacter sp. 3D3]GAU76538.1 nucleotidyltransferase [Fusibacter sp. 3D3]